MTCEHPPDRLLIAFHDWRQKTLQCMDCMALVVANPDDGLAVGPEALVDER